MEAIARIHEKIDSVISSTISSHSRRIGQMFPLTGHYAGFVRLDSKTLLAMHVDGVGTKTLIAEKLGNYTTIGIDCVAMNVNDLICVGAEPIALVDYIALNHDDATVVKQIIQGLVKGARIASVAIVGGETAVMPDLMKGLDLSAASIGIVREKDLITGQEIRIGDLIIGLPSSGIHSNGMTLARKVLFRNGFDPAIGKQLLKPTRIYVRDIRGLFEKKVKIHGLAHITGSAFAKLKRLGTRASMGFLLDRLFPPQPIFRKIQRAGKIQDKEMYRTFNMGTGFLVVCPPHDAQKALATLPDARIVGIVTRDTNVTVKLGSKQNEIVAW